MTAQASVTVTWNACVSAVSGVPVMRPFAASASWLGRLPPVQREGIRR